MITIAASSARRRVQRERTHEATSIATTCQPYFRRIARTVGRAASPVSTAAVPRHVGAPGATIPRRSQGRRVTSEKLWTRFTLPAVTSVVNPTVSSPRSTIQTAVSTVVPLRRRVAIETYRCEPTISGEVTTGNYRRVLPARAMELRAATVLGMSLELVPLCTATITLAKPIVVSPTLTIGELTSVEYEGDRIRASMKGQAAADWIRIGPDGVGTLDVKLAVETDDGATIYAEYSGRMQFDTMTIYAAPLFHTGDERYAWLNRVQAVAKGTFPERGKLVYEIYELV